MKQLPHRQPDDPRRPGQLGGEQSHPQSRGARRVGPLVEFKPVGLGAARVRLVADLAGKLSLSARYVGSAGVAQLLADEEAEPVFDEDFDDGSIGGSVEALTEAPIDDEARGEDLDSGLGALLDAVLDAALDDDLDETLEDTMIEAMEDTLLSGQHPGPVAAELLSDPFASADEGENYADLQAAFDEDEEDEFDEFEDDDEEFDDEEDEDDEFDDDEDEDDDLDDEEEEDDLDDEEDDLDDEEDFDDD